MALGRYVGDHDRFLDLQQRLAEPLALVGLRISDQGEVATARATATTLDEVAELAGRLHSELNRRGVHPQVLAYCRVELIRHSLFHATFEAVKGLAERLRQLLDSGLDGADLVDHGFSGAKGRQPRLTINRYATESEQSEHRGFANLLKGLFGTFRNPPAHTPRSRLADRRSGRPRHLLDAPYIHRRLDGVAAQARP